MKKRVIIMGAAGRDFHNFNVYFRDNPDYEVIAFTATQIPNIENRVYPKQLAGKLYPKGIPIYPEEKLEELIKTYRVDLVVFAYSDVPHKYVMNKASKVLASGADYLLLGPKSTMLKSNKPVIAICAVRTGAGKSQTTRKVADILKHRNKKFVIVRHPMSYRDFIQQKAEKFYNYDDLKNCTIEEREEFEPYIKKGIPVYCGVDYKEILIKAEKEAEIIVWDGGNNDFPFYQPDLLIVVVDPLRIGNETNYHPGETCLLMADIVIINKIDTAKKEDIEKLKNTIKNVNPKAKIIEAESKIFVDNPEIIKNKSVLVIEDGPTLTHGGMSFGAGFVCANNYEAKEIIDPRPYAIGSIAEIYKKYTQINKILPSMGYTTIQIKELETTINNTPADTVIIATPVDLTKIIKINKPVVKVYYELNEISSPTLNDLIKY